MIWPEFTRKTVWSFLMERFHQLDERSCLSSILITFRITERKSQLERSARSLKGRVELQNARSLQFKGLRPTMSANLALVRTGRMRCRYLFNPLASLPYSSLERTLAI
jgi:hypothetical protein